MLSASSPIIRLFPAVASLLLAGCVAAPQLGPEPEVRSGATVASERSLATASPGVWPTEEWWHSFGDPQLDALMAEGLKNSPDVAMAAARYRIAAGVAQEAGAARFPSLNAEGTVYEERRSLNSGFRDEIKQFLPRGWRAGGDVSARFDYDIDLWGRNRAALAAATSEARAAAVDAREAQLMLTTGIADAYADLGRLFAERDIRRLALEVRLTTQKLVSRRLENGLEMRGSLRQADAQVSTARSLLAATDEAIELRRHQIAALVGAGPDRGLSLVRPAIATRASQSLPASVTTDLLGRRPDIAAARERVAAGDRRIDVARADFFPAIRLEALIGVQSLGLDALFGSDSLYGRAGPAISLPIFNGGALRGRYRAARGSFDLAVANYNAAVIAAYRDVADAVTSRDYASTRLTHAREALAASQEAYAIAKQRYEGGLSGYLDVLAVEDRMLEARLAVAELEASVIQLDVALIGALGGGYDAAMEDRVGEIPHG